MKKSLLILTLIFTLNIHAENNKTKKMSNEDVDKWFKEYIVLVDESKKRKLRIKKLDKLNNTLDKLTTMLKVNK